MQNIGYRLSLAAFALVLVGAGCGSTSPSTEVGVNTGTDNSAGSAAVGSCSPLKVTVDGVDVSGQYTNALSYTGVSMGYRTEIVQLYNGDKFNYTCEDVLGSGRIDSADLDMVGASYNDLSYAQMVNFGSDNYPTPTELVAPASGVGSTQTVCATEVSWTGMTGPTAGKQITVSGALSGTYCGDKQM